MKNFGQKVIKFHKALNLGTKLPENIKVMNPYADNQEIQLILQEFYTRYFADHKKRKLLVGINPGRLGAGVTGIPFTDTKRLQHNCGIDLANFESHAPSSVFVYEVIEAFGGAEKFYKQFYINSVCPLGFIRKNKKKHWVNCNYYDYKTLFSAVKPFIISTLKQQIDFGIDTSVCFSLGKKNAKFLSEINKEENLFKKIVALPHPRYIVQYKSKQKEKYITDYLSQLTNQ